MSDIIERLRNPARVYSHEEVSDLDEVRTVADMKEAADEIVRLRATLQTIVDGNQVECRNVAEIDPAGNTYAIHKVDGEWAAIARRSLEQTARPKED